MPPPAQTSFLRRFFTPSSTTRAAASRQPLSSLLATVSVSLRDHMSCLLRIHHGAFERTELDDKHEHLKTPLRMNERWCREAGRGRQERLQKMMRERNLMMQGQVQGKGEKAAEVAP